MSGINCNVFKLSPENAIVSWNKLVHCLSIFVHVVYMILWILLTKGWKNLDATSASRLKEDNESVYIIASLVEFPHKYFEALLIAKT